MLHPLAIGEFGTEKPIGVVKDIAEIKCSLIKNIPIMRFAQRFGQVIQRGIRNTIFLKLRHRAVLHFVIRYVMQFVDPVYSRFALIHVPRRRCLRGIFEHTLPGGVDIKPVQTIEIGGAHDRG